MTGIGKNFKQYARGIKIRLKKTSYGEVWKDQTLDDELEFYDELYKNLPLLHENFFDYVKKKNDIKTVLEVGCGTGVYPIKFKELFSGMKYLGMDFSETAIEFCKKNSNFEFMSGDFIKMNLKKNFDLVFSHAVIDHVYDPDAFLTNIVKACGKYAYVSAYRGYFPDLKKHNLEWNNRKGCYHNELSVSQIQSVLEKNGLKTNEFSIREQPNGKGEKDPKKNVDTVIEIHRENGIS